jgi:hypothetical protein
VADDYDFGAGDDLMLRVCSEGQRERPRKCRTLGKADERKIDAFILIRLQPGGHAVSI